MKMKLMLVIVLCLAEKILAEKGTIKKNAIIFETRDLSKDTIKPPKSNAEQGSVENEKRPFVIKLNGGIDFTLGLLRWLYTNDGELTVKLPDFREKFGHDIYTGTFNASNGYFRNLGSLHRTGDVSFIKEGSSVAVEVTLGLSEMEAGYNNFTFNILNIHQNGKLNLSVTNNSISMKLVFSYAPKCSLKLEYVKFKQFCGLELKTTGLGIYQDFFNLVTKWFIKNFEDKIQNFLNKKFNDKLTKLIEQRGDIICNYFPRIF